MNLNQLTKATMPEKPTNGNINKIQSYQNAMKEYICSTYKNLQQVAKSADLDPQSKTEDGSDINIANICGISISNKPTNNPISSATNGIAKFGSSMASVGTAIAQSAAITSPQPSGNNDSVNTINKLRQNIKQYNPNTNGNGNAISKRITQLGLTENNSNVKNFRAKTTKKNSGIQQGNQGSTAQASGEVVPTVASTEVPVTEPSGEVTAAEASGEVTTTEASAQEPAEASAQEPAEASTEASATEASTKPPEESHGGGKKKRSKSTKSKSTKSKSTKSKSTKSKSTKSKSTKSKSTKSKSTKSKSTKSKSTKSKSKK